MRVRRDSSDPRDYVRLELEAALSKRMRVVPVLVHGARLPKPRELPDGLVPLLDRNAWELTRQHWEWDVDKLISALERESPEEAISATTATSPAPAPYATDRPHRAATAAQLTAPEGQSTTGIRTAGLEAPTAATVERQFLLGGSERSRPPATPWLKRPIVLGLAVVAVALIAVVAALVIGGSSGGGTSAAELDRRPHCFGANCQRSPL